LIGKWYTDGIMSVIVDKVLCENVEYLLQTLQRKFKSKTLKISDFEIDDISFLCDENYVEINELEQKSGLDNFEDFELDFQDGEVKMTSSKRTPPLVKTLSKDEIEFREHMDRIMTMFENETRQLDYKIENERQRMHKKYQTKLLDEVQTRTNHLTDTIKNLRNRVQALEADMGELVMSFEEEKKNLEEFYLKKMESDRNEMKMKMIQLKLSNKQNNNNKSSTIPNDTNGEWQKTKI
jgi:hypothetical protein